MKNQKKCGNPAGYSDSFTDFTVLVVVHDIEAQGDSLQLLDLILELPELWVEVLQSCSGFVIGEMCKWVIDQVPLACRWLPIVTEPLLNFGGISLLRLLWH